MSLLLDETFQQKGVSQFPINWFLICENLLYVTLITNVKSMLRSN